MSYDAAYLAASWIQRKVGHLNIVAYVPSNNRHVVRVLIPDVETAVWNERSYNWHDLDSVQQVLDFIA